MDHIEKYHFYINLRERTEKNKNTREELKRFGIHSPNRFEAIKHEIGIVGCVKSHIRCIELAKERGYPFVCIFEDDIVFRNVEKCREMIHKYINYDYDVLYLGCRVLNNQYDFITDELIRINSSYCNHAYLIKSHYYEILLKNFYDGMELKIKAGKEKHDQRLSEEFNIDVYSNSLERKDKWYLFYPHFVSQKNGYSDNFNQDINFCDEIFKIPIHENHLPHISILTPTCNRKQFLPLMINNMNGFNYPKKQIEWNILESNDNSSENYDKLFNDKDEIKDLEETLGIEINYKYIDTQISIGEKRNMLSKSSSYEYLINMDDDDLYLPSYLNHSIDILMNHQTDITGSLDMLFIYPRKDYQMSYIRCDRNFRFYHEATLCMKKTHWKKYKYTGSNQGEGENIFGNAKYCSLSDIIKCMICVCWEGNTINKDIFLKNHINMQIHGTSLTILKKVLSDSHKMEGDTPAIQLEKKSVIINPTEKIEINLELLLNIRNLITVTNDRINWKIEELLPVGIIIQQIDESLKNHNQ